MADVVTLDDIDSSRTRRSWLKILAAIVGAGGVGWWLFGDAKSRPRAVSLAIDPNIDAIAWDGQVLHVEIAADTVAEEWAVIHEYHEGPSDAIATGRVPEFGGDVTVNMGAAMAQSGLDFPTRRFEFILYDLTTADDGVSVDIQRDSGVAVEVPKK